MTQEKNNIFYYYDRNYDDLLVKLDNRPSYSEEVHNNIYLIYSEDNDEIIGTQIMYLKNRSKKILQKYLPEKLFNFIMGLEV